MFLTEEPVEIPAKPRSGVLLKAKAIWRLVRGRASTVIRRQREQRELRAILWQAQYIGHDIRKDIGMQDHVIYDALINSKMR